MEEYIDQVEKFLRGQMSQLEENSFRESLISNENLRSFVFIVVFMLKVQKSG